MAIRVRLIFLPALLSLCLLLVVATGAAEEISVAGRVTRYHSPLEFHEALLPSDLPLSAMRGCVASGDIDGDRRDELFIADFDRREISLISVTGRAAVSSLMWARFSGERSFERCVSGDFSGDGLVDLALMVRGGQEWLFFISARAASPVQRPVSFDIPHTEVSRVFATIHPERSTRDSLFLSAQGELSSRWVAATGGEFLWFHRGPLLRGEFAGEFSGGGGDDLLMSDFVEPEAWSLRTRWPEGARMPGYAWTGYEWRNDWKLRGRGDFNGDGLDDLLLEGDQIKGWWVGLSDSTQVLLQPLRGLSRGRKAVTTGDFDGDGLADLVSLTGEGSPMLWFAFAIRGVGEPGVTISASGGAKVTTDGQGEFNISVGSDETLKPEKLGFVFSQSELAMRYRFGRVRRRADFIATDIAGGDGVIGRAVVLGRSSGPGPYACIGYNPESPQSWGEMGGRCHPGYAYFSFRDLGREDTSSRRIRAGGACCRLPADDILTGEVVETFERCPDGYVGIGGRIPAVNENYLICGKVNTERYQLGPVSGGRYFGVGYSMWKERNRTEGSQIPIALRYALGRENYTNWTGEQCVGVPPGALVVGKRPGSCAAIEFRELQYVGRAGDPSQGTPVKMVPDCERIENEFDPLSGCRP